MFLGTNGWGMTQISPKVLSHFARVAGDRSRSCRLLWQERCLISTGHKDSRRLRRPQTEKPVDDQTAQTHHKVERVDRDGGGRYVLQCLCGWTSGPGGSAATVGTEWDEHLSTAAADAPTE